MKLRLFTITIFSLVFITIPIDAQVIHKSELENFVGLIQFNEDASIKLIDYGVNVEFSELDTPEGINPFFNDEYSFAFWPNKKMVQYLNVEELDIMIVAFHNGGYESGRSMLSLWNTQGDSLSFDRFIITNSIKLGFAQLEQNYTTNLSDDLVFVIKDEFGDGGKMRGTYHFVALDKNKTFYPLLAESYYGVSGSESHILYKFIWKKDLLILRTKFSKTNYFETINGINYELSNRTVDDYSQDVFDLTDLVYQAKQQN